MILLSPNVKFQAVLLYSRFRVAGHFEIRAPNDPNIEPYKVKGTLYMCYWSPRVTNFSSFPLRPTVSELQAILREVHRMSLKLILNTIRSEVLHIRVTNVPDSQISPDFLYDQPCSRCKIVDNWKCTE